MNIAARAPNSPEIDSRADFDLNLIKQLLADGSLTEKQFRHCQRIKQKLSDSKSLVAITEELGYANKEIFLKAIAKSRKYAPLGEILITLGIISDADLRQALTIQKDASDKKPLGKILVENHLVSEERVIQVVAAQKGIPKIEPDFAKTSPNLLAMTTALWCQKNQMVPVGKTKKHVLVGCRDPLDPANLRLAQEVFGRETYLVFSTSRSITEFTNAFIRTSSKSELRKSETSEAALLVNQIISDAITMGASDIHIEPIQKSLRIRFRTDGVMTLYKHFEQDKSASIISRLKVLSGADISEKRLHQDGRISFEDPVSGQKVDLRASFYVTIFGEKAVLRILLNKVELLGIEELGLSPRSTEVLINDVLDIPSGIILVTGPTGSGKTTTLYSCVNYLNNLERCVITAEDPVEYLVEGISQCSLNNKVGLTYKNTLPAMVRQDPDVIVLGEIRDNFSAEAAIQAALTGHKVLTTFHTEDTIGGLLRLMNMNIETFLISSTVVSVLAQRLLRRLCEHCKQPATATAKQISRLGYTPEEFQSTTEFYEAKGCEKCRFSGYSGRVGVYELLVLNEQVKDAILHNKSSHRIRRISFETSEMTTLLEDGILRAHMGQTSLDEVLKRLPRIEKPRPLPILKRLAGVR